MNKIRFNKAFPIVIILVIALLVLGACSSKSTTSKTTTTTTTSTVVTTTSTTANSVTVNLAAQNFAFNLQTITVPRGATVVINFDNKDSGVPHNFAVYTDSSAATKIFGGTIINGPKTTTYTFTAPSTAGTYFFRCDLHPTQMTGSFIVQ